MTFKDSNILEIWQTVFEVCLGEHGDLGTTNARIVWVLVGWGLINFKIGARVANVRQQAKQLSAGFLFIIKPIYKNFRI